MECFQCHHTNRSTAKFCEECGTPLAKHCPRCQHASRPGAKFCDQCGHALTAPTPAEHEVSLKAAVIDRFHARLASYTPRHLSEKILASKSAMEGERKQVTVLFADIAGSTTTCRATRSRRGAPVDGWLLRAAYRRSAPLRRDRLAMKRAFSRTRSRCSSTCSRRKPPITVSSAPAVRGSTRRLVWP